MSKKKHTIKPSKIIQKLNISNGLNSISLQEKPHKNNNIIYLDKNENPFSPPLDDFDDLNPLDLIKNYPEPDSATFLDILSQKIRIPSSYLLAGSGSDELLDLIIRAYSTPRTTFLSVSPTFSMYQFYTKINSSKYKSIPLNLKLNKTTGIARYELEPEIFIQKAKNFRIIILARPNNPDGSILPVDLIERLLRLEKLIIVDEAYIDFSLKPSVVELIQKYENLIILRSFSKSYSLAGLRLGYIITNPSIKNLLSFIKNPYNVNSLALYFGSQLLQKQNKISANNKRIRLIRENFHKDLINLRKNVKQFFIHPSEANFILLRFLSAEASSSLHKHFLNHQIIVRCFKGELSNCLRISIGTMLQMKKVIEILELYFEVN